MALDRHRVESKLGDFVAGALQGRPLETSFRWKQQTPKTHFWRTSYIAGDAREISKEMNSHRYDWEAAGAAVGLTHWNTKGLDIAGPLPHTTDLELAPCGRRLPRYG